jgi:hypothetical protein
MIVTYDCKLFITPAAGVHEQRDQREGVPASAHRCHEHQVSAEYHQVPIF